jgi:pimeloyl-ACP methyl ester carboxylesterase
MMSFRSCRSLTINAVASLLVGSVETPAAAPASWGKLAPGPYAVGFRSLWQLDYSRVYNTTFDDKTAYASGKAPRPILINIWYPAERSDELTPMPHRDYFRIQTEDPRLARFASKLIDYERDTASVEVMGTPIIKLNQDERRSLDRLWDAGTACLRDAPPLDARFPLIIYHSGAGSSFDDNAVFCEFLASHGYVVIGSAFQDGTGKSLAVDGRDASERDLEFLIAHARRQPNVDWQHIGLVGHSLGAQAILMFRAQAASPVDAVVSLDTTQDYHTLASPGWHDMTRRLGEKSSYVTGPLLMFASAKALFQLADSLERAERYYFTLRDQNHNDFIDQGLQRRTVESEAKPGDRDLQKALASARAGYESVCSFALNFFDSYLKKQPGPHDDLVQKFRDTRLGGDQPHVEYLPMGATGPEPYHDDRNMPPALRQIHLIIADRGISATVGLLKRWREKEPESFLCQEDFGFALVDECLGYGRTQDAIAIKEFYSAHDATFSKIFLRTGNGCRTAGLSEFAIDYYKKASLLDPSDAEAVARLKELTELKKK